MQRDLYKELVKWKNERDRKPLLIEGVRGCGKTYLLKQFGAENYKRCVHFDFEESPELRSFFDEDLDPKRIVRDLSALYDLTIDADTLIIFDEIQACAKALTSLKYFCENGPEYHVACGCSLLSVPTRERGSFPVGKVDFLHMGPMSFREFLIANGDERIFDYAESLGRDKLVSPVLSSIVGKQLIPYCLVGGMPEAVSAWFSGGSYLAVREVHKKIMERYERDFSTHAIGEYEKLTLIMKSIPAQLSGKNKKFFYGHVKSGARAKDLEYAVYWLVSSGIVRKVTEISEPTLPLRAYWNPTRFKLYLADTGLLCTMMKIPPEAMLFDDPLYSGRIGAIAENYVLSELLNLGKEPYYWRSGGTAEIEFVVQSYSGAIPIEVKCGRNQRANSLESYIKKYSPPKSVLISMDESVDGPIIRIPLHSVWRFDRYTDEKKDEDMFLFHNA